MEHAINVATRHVIMYLVPKQHSKATSNSDNEGSDEEDSGDGGNDGDSGVGVGFTSGEDVLKKALSLVKQVCTLCFSSVSSITTMQIHLSPQAQAFFQKLCWEVGLKELELTQWVHVEYWVYFP
jgi:hypothetical protein